MNDEPIIPLKKIGTMRVGGAMSIADEINRELDSLPLSMWGIRKYLAGILARIAERQREMCAEAWVRSQTIGVRELDRDAIETTLRRGTTFQAILNAKEES